MRSPRKGTPTRRKAAWSSALVVGGLLATTTGCQVEYAGMTLPSGKYMYDDVQYFPPGPRFPWSNTQAAQQRARMQAMGLDVADLPQPGLETTPVVGAPPAAGSEEPQQNRDGRPENLNQSILRPPAGIADPGAGGGAASPAPAAPAGG